MGVGAFTIKKKDGGNFVRNVFVFLGEWSGNHPSFKDLKEKGQTGGTQNKAVAGNYVTKKSLNYAFSVSW